MLLLSRRLPEHVAVQEGFLRVPGPADIEALRTGLDAVSTRHGALRLRVHRRAGRYVQVVEDRPIEVAVRRWSSGAPTMSDLRAWARACPELEVRLAGGRVASFGIAACADQSAVVVVRAHHVVVDWWSMATIARDIGRVHHDGAALGPAFDFGAYAHEQAARAASPAGRRDVEHWIESLQGAGLARLPRSGDDSLGPPSPRRVHRIVERDVVERLRSLARDTRSTVFALALAGVAAALAPIAPDGAVVLPIELANRPRRELLGEVGCFATTVFVRVVVQGHETVGALVDHVRSVTLDALQRQGADPFEVVAGSGIAGAFGRGTGTILFQWRPRLGDADSRSLAPITDGARGPVIQVPTDVHIVMREGRSGIHLWIDHDASAVTGAQATDLADAIVRSLTRMAGGADTPMRDLHG